MVYAFAGIASSGMEMNEFRWCTKATTIDTPPNDWSAIAGIAVEKRIVFIKFSVSAAAAATNGNFATENRSEQERNNHKLSDTP